MRHFLGANPRIKLLLCDEAELQSSLTQTDVFAVCRQGDLRRLLISNVWIEGGHQHQRVVEMFFDPFFVRLDADRAAIAE